MTSRSYTNPPSSEIIDDLWLAPWGQAAVTAAMRTGIFTSLAQQSRTVEQVARASKLNTECTRSVLHVLVGQRLLRKNAAEQFSLVPAARYYLDPQSPYNKQAQLADLSKSKQAAFIESKLKAKNAKQRAFGETWKDPDIDSDEVKEVAAGMDAIILPAATSAARSGAFSGYSRMLDVGGGSGACAAEITKHNKQLHMMVMDLPAMCRQAQKYLKRRKANRVDTYGADFFGKDWPSGFDAVFMSNVLHDWPLAQCRKLLSGSRKAMVRLGRNKPAIFILESILSENRCSPAFTAIFHMQMQMAFGGRQFTKNELRDLLRSTGFGVPRVVSTFGHYSLIKATIADHD